MKCTCPKTSITTIEALACFENIGQIHKLIFQRAGYQFVAGTNPFNAASSWTPLFAAALDDDTKAVITPRILNFIIPKTTEITETIDNETFTIDGSEARATGMARKWPSSIIKQLRETLMCESDLSMFAINRSGQLIGTRTATTPNEIIEGIPITTQSGFVGDSGGDSKSAVASADIALSLPFGWRDDLVIVDPEAGFNPLSLRTQ